MPVVKMTAKWVENVKSRGARVEYWDSDLQFNNGARLGLRVGRKKVWTLHYRGRRNKKVQRLKLGEYDPLRPDHVTLEEARESARGEVGKLLKQDPVAERARAKGAPTIAELCDAYIKQYAKVQKKSWRKDEQHLRLRIIPVLGDERVNAVNRWDLTEVLDEVARSNPIAANRTLEVVRKMFNWAGKRKHFGELLEANPAQFIENPAPENKRRRVLKKWEIKRIWDSWGQLESGPCFKLIALTAARRGNVLRMRWEDLDKDVWVVPLSEAKTDIEYIVPLSTQARELLENIPKSHDTVFHPTLYFDIDHEQNRVRALCGVTDYRLHDWRRTCASTLASLKTEQLILDCVLGHSTGEISKGARARYNQYRYLDETREAMQLWADYLMETVYG